ncbi:glycoside hydrolase family 16 protein [Nocardioides pelophilus]|uniref:glycoside hydrolase family 16 protein n=1 Tax=Nocardioides pelophilus TaxID=2172019 RepID=UPI001600487B|nr:glycoside hydrolase family 16 protein [Nocardioides pelophilus]
MLIRSVRFRALIVIFACLIATAGAVVDAPPSDAGRRVTLDRPRATTDAVVLNGEAPARARVRIMRRTAEGWVRVATDRANRRGNFRVRLDRPTESSWVVRAVSLGDRSGKRYVAPAPTLVEPGPSDACGVQPRKADGSLWECTFVENFDGSALDTTKWQPQDTSVTGIPNGTACYLPKPWNLKVADGALRLSAQKLASPFTCRSPYGDFVTDRVAATVTTKGRFNQAYGRFEFRAKMPNTAVRGVHSALWLYPDKHTYGKWPLSGEIDVMEWFSALPKRVFPSVHYVDGLKDVYSGLDNVVANASVFHTYAVEWTPTTMSFYYDGKLAFKHSWTPLAPLFGSQPFDKPFNVVLTQAWGGQWNSPIDETADRATMTVDWVRVWK